MTDAARAGTTPGKRERNHLETSRAIERNAVALVREVGLDRVTVDMICERAGVSQRTFFNYFKTKETAILGTDLPSIDEGRAREFLASRGPVIAGALGLISLAPGTDPRVDELARDRIAMIAQNPDLLVRQMERLTVVHQEMAEIVYLRFARDRVEGESDAHLREQAELATGLLASILRFVAMRSAGMSDGSPGPGSGGTGGFGGRGLPLMAPPPGASLDTGPEVDEVIAHVLRKLGDPGEVTSPADR